MTAAEVAIHTRVWATLQQQQQQQQQKKTSSAGASASPTCDVPLSS
jgi:hypothetical protein